MKLFRLLRPKLLRRRELRRLKKRVFESPTPEGVRDLAHRLVWASETEEALRVVEEGVERFPESDSLKSFLASFKKNRLRETIDRLLQILETRPLPEAYGQLAEIYRDVGELDHALEICHRCVDKFPESDIPYLVQGRIGLDRFQRTRTVRDGRFAVDNFQRAAEIDRFNLRAHIHLAEIFAAIGAPRTALHHLERVSHQFVLDDRLKSLEEVVLHQVEASSSSADAPGTEDIDCLLIQVETDEKFAFDPWSVETVSNLIPDQLAAREELDQKFGGLEGIHGVALVVGNGPEADGADALESAVTQVATVGDASARKMDLGNMSGAYVSGDFGHLVIRKVRGATAAVLCADESVAKSLREPLQDYLVRHFG